MKISYLVTCKDETNTLSKLLERLLSFVSGDEIIILHDIPSSSETIKIIEKYNQFPHKIGGDALNRDYSKHKNAGNSLCSGDYIFQCDGDELPSINLLNNLKDIIEHNLDVELIFVPRINDFKGVTGDHAKQWGWRLDNSPTYNRSRVNWPDYQGRIYKNVPNRIKWDRALHEKIIGHNQYSFLPAEEDYALYHDKTIEKQIETNIRYNKIFSEEDNKGHKVV